jgi:hypothetical protein
MLTTMVIVPDGPEPLDDRVKVETRKGWPASEWTITRIRPVKEPHLPTKTGVPYWVTLEDKSDK